MTNNRTHQAPASKTPISLFREAITKIGDNQGSSYFDWTFSCKKYGSEEFNISATKTVLIYCWFLILGWGCSHNFRRGPKFHWIVQRENICLHLHFNALDFCTKCVIFVTTLFLSTFSTRETITFFVFADAKNKDKNMVIIFKRYFGLYSFPCSFEILSSVIMSMQVHKSCIFHMMMVCIWSYLWRSECTVHKSESPALLNFSVWYIYIWLFAERYTRLKLMKTITAVVTSRHMTSLPLLHPYRVSIRHPNRPFRDDRCWWGAFTGAVIQCCQLSIGFASIHNLQPCDHNMPTSSHKKYH